MCPPRPLSPWRCRFPARWLPRRRAASVIELEDVLLDRLPETTEVVVLAVAGREPIPVLSTTDDIPLDRADWVRATKDLPPLAEPIQIPWSQFPRTATWKIHRVQLREQLFSGSEAMGVGRWT